jgi:hypothetical protein
MILSGHFLLMSAYGRSGPTPPLGKQDDFQATRYLPGRFQHSVERRSLGRRCWPGCNQITANYGVYWAGLHFGDVRLVITVRGSRYKMKGNGRFSVMGSLTATGWGTSVARTLWWSEDTTTRSNTP